MLRFLREPLVVFSSMNAKQHLYYWVLPLLAGWTFTLMYFSGIPWMAEVIAPSYDREFGLLENLQALLIVCTLVVLIATALLPMRLAFRIVAVLACVGAAAMFLEEIDYGLHWLEWVRGIQPGTGAKTRNLHNQGRNTANLKLIANLILGALFALLPYIDRLKQYRLVKAVCPSRMLVFTVLATVLVALLHHLLDPYNLPTNRALDSNQSEFEEMLIYYAFFVYFRERLAEFRSDPCSIASLAI
jgi:hypothetical protein